MPQQPQRPSVLRKAAQSGAGMIILTSLALAPQIGRARAAAEPPLAQQFDAAAVDGPGALLNALSQRLANEPALAATPASAAALARAAAAPVPNFVGATAPVYRDIADRIIAAAPAGQRTAVTQAVNDVLRTYTELDLKIAPPVRPDTMRPTGMPSVPAETYGFKVGSFTIYPSVQAASYYDDNIYATSHNHVVDWVGTISPGIAIQSDWDRHSFYAEAQTDLTGYWSHVHENTVDWHASAEGDIDVTDNTRVLLGGVVLQEHEDRASPDAVEGLEPTPYSEQNGYVGVVHRFDQFTLRLGGAIERITFGNVMGTHGEINNQDRDRFRYTFGGLLRYEANPNFRPFVEALGDIRRYDTTPDDFGFNRDSGGFLSGVGALYKLGPNISGEVFVGVLHRSYEDPTFKSLTTPAADATLRWQATPRTAVVLFTERTIEETTLSASPGYIYTLAGGRLEQGLTDRLTGLLRFAYGHSDFAQVGRADNEIDASAGLHYHLTQKWTIGVDYRYTQRVSGSSLVDFARNEVYFRVGVDF